MVRKRKKKPTKPSAPSLREQKNEFFRMLKELCFACAAPEAFDLFTKEDLAFLFLNRYKHLQISFLPHPKLNSEMRKTIRAIAKYHLCLEEVSFVEEGETRPYKGIRIYDYYVVGPSLGLFLKNRAPYSPHFESFLRMFGTFWVHHKSQWRFNHASEICKRLFFTLNKMNFGFLTFKPNVFDVINDLAGGKKHWGTVDSSDSSYIYIGVEYIPQKSVHAIFDGKRRIAFENGWPDAYGRLHIQRIRAGVLELDGVDPKQWIDVYIQSHAMQRMRERMDGILEPFLICNIQNSLALPKVKKVGDFYYLDYTCPEKKAGYMVCSLYKQQLIVRTFLFITYKGTPEGRKLQRLLHCSKFDISVMKLDRISTFTLGDLCQNPDFVEILRQCNMDHLLSLNKQYLYTQDDRKSQGELTPLVDKITSYFGLSNTVDVQDDVEVMDQDLSTIE